MVIMSFYLTEIINNLLENINNPFSNLKCVERYLLILCIKNTKSIEIVNAI